MKPSEVIEAIQEAVESAAVERTSPADVMRRIRTVDEVTGKDRQFVIRAEAPLPDIPDPPESGNCKRVMWLQVQVAYGQSLERVMDDAELINTALRGAGGSLPMKVMELESEVDDETVPNAQIAIFRAKVRYTRG